jgi:hypothetical protein
MRDELFASMSFEDRFEQVLAELLEAEECGGRPDLSELLRTAPELETRLREYLRDRDGFDRLAPNLAPTASHPGLPPHAGLASGGNQPSVGGKGVRNLLG